MSQEDVVEIVFTFDQDGPCGEPALIVSRKDDWKRGSLSDSLPDTDTSAYDYICSIAGVEDMEAYWSIPEGITQEEVKAKLLADPRFAYSALQPWQCRGKDLVLELA